MAYTNPYNVEDKEDSAEKTAYAAGKPTKHFLFGLEFNGIKSAFATITGWINALLSSKEDKVSGVIAFGSDNYTATVPNLTELVEGYKILFLFENPNTGASTINVNGLGVKEIRKEFDVQLVADDLKGVRWLMYDGINFQVASHFGTGGGGSSKFLVTSFADGNAASNGNWFSFSKTLAGYDQRNFTSYGSTFTLSALFTNGLPNLVPKGTQLVEAYLDINTGAANPYHIEIHTNEISNGATASTVTANNNQLLVQHSFTTAQPGFSKNLITLPILSHVNMTEFTELYWIIKGPTGGNNMYNPKILLYFQ
jgi:hypothetical protein